MRKHGPHQAAARSPGRPAFDKNRLLALLCLRQGLRVVVLDERQFREQRRSKTGEEQQRQQHPFHWNAGMTAGWAKREQLGRDKKMDIHPSANSTWKISMKPLLFSMRLTDHGRSTTSSRWTSSRSPGGGQLLKTINKKR